MNIEDFLPKYPDILEHSESELNLYDDSFYDAIFKKKEFYEERLPKPSEEEPFPEEKGTLLKSQKLIAKFLSSYTMYDSLLLIHEMGSGKTCTAIGVIEKIKNEINNYKGVYVFAKGVNLLNNFVRELRDKCTAGIYLPEDFAKGSERENVIRTRKLYEDYYNFRIGDNKPTTFQTFAKHLNGLKDSEIINRYSNHILVIDEVHNLRIQDYTEEDSISIYDEFHRFLHLVDNCKILLMSGTPMKLCFCIQKHNIILNYLINPNNLNSNSLIYPLFK